MEKFPGVITPYQLKMNSWSCVSIVHTYNPSYTGWIVVPGQLNKKFTRPSSQWGKKMGVGGIHLSSQLWLRLMVQVGRGYKARPYLKNNQSKKGWQHALSGRVLDYESPEFDHQ
jgi:hypothetical protein